MKKIVSFLTLIILLTNCSVPYDGETRYIFETTVLDSDNNSIANLKRNAIFYNLYNNGNKGIESPSVNGDLIVSTGFDTNEKSKNLPLSIGIKFKNDKKSIQ
jgi:hypothetical protein